MIAAWMLYCLLCGLGLAAAAALAERALFAGRGPVRGVWIIALGLSFMVPAAAHRFAPRTQSGTVTTNVRSTPTLDQTFDSTFASPSTLPASARSATATPDWRALSKLAARAEEPLAVLWLTLSSAVLIHFFSGVVMLSWLRRSWRREEVLGVDVFVSREIGPALVGALAPAIVLPEWALEMDPSQLSLMLEHEQEHRRTRDSQLLTLAQWTLILMPWNLALWWQLARLRLAVELDCDARVLRRADARSYGNLLLDVARPRRNPMFLGATAFAERAAELEVRIRAIARRRQSRSRRMTAVAVSIGVAALTVAWIAPRPAVRQVHYSVMRPAAPLHLPRLAAIDTPPPVPLSVRDSAPQPRADSRRHVTPVPLTAVPVDTPTRADTGRPRPKQILVVPMNPLVADSLYDFLFSGIPLLADQADQAHRLLVNLQQAQISQTLALLQRMESTLTQRNAMQAQLDSTLLSLLSGEAAIETLRTRLPQSLSAGGGRGGRGGIGGPGTGGSISPDGARGGGRSAGNPIDPVDGLYSRLFEGINMSPEQETAARRALLVYQQKVRIMQPPPPPAILGVSRNPVLVIMQPASDSALLSLLTSEADRATLQSRIMVLPPTPRPPM